MVSEMFHSPDIECLPREQLCALQLQRLQATVRRVYENVEFYRAKMQAAGITPADIQKPEDIRLLPFTTKQDLRDTYPFGLFAAPQSEVVRVHASSGTTGKPTVVGYTKKDIAVWQEVVARALAMAGVDTSDTLQVAYGYGLFTGGLGLHYGGEARGCRVVPMSSGNTQKQLMLMQDFGTTALACTPSYALHLAEEIERLGIDTALRVGIFGAEPWSLGMRQEIERRLKVRAHDIYGLSEIMGPGVSMECQYQNGLHIAEDHFWAEIVDTDTLAPLPDGVEGELVFTCITKEALPLIRYRTRDISALDTSVCACGRTHARMSRVRDRSDDMLIIRGVNVYPSQVASVLAAVEGLSAHFHVVVDRLHNADSLEVQVELPDGIRLDTVAHIEALRRRLTTALQSTLGLSVQVTMLEHNSLERSVGKTVRVTDKRVK